MIHETLNTKITDSCDVLVCGGGIAGISAALAAARLGKRVILLEKQYMLGGLATAGLVTIYLPLCDGMGQQVSFGIAEELLRLSISLGYEGKYPSNWLDSTLSVCRTSADPRFQVQFNPSLLAILTEQRLLECGVSIHYGTSAVSISMEEQRIRHVITENKSGRHAIAVRTVVDATGDCDIVHFANAPTALFKQGNVLAAWYYTIERGKYKLHQVGCADIPEDQKNEHNQVDTIINRRFQGVDGKEISEMVQLSHRAVLDHLEQRRLIDSSTIPTAIASIPQLRMTRKIKGQYTLDSTQIHTYFPDSIGMVSDWRRRGPIYEVPFGTLYSACVKNLICAGRCISVTDSMWDIMRVIPCCAVTGQAAGTAAALSDNFDTLDIEKLQEILRANGVVLHEKDLKSVTLC